MTQDDVIKEGYAKNIYKYAYNASFINANLLTKALLESKIIPDYYTYFECFEEDDFNIYPRSFEDEKEYYDYPEVDYYYYLFARGIMGADISLIESRLDNFDERIIYLFARDIKGANIELLQSKMKYANPKYLYLFARDVEGTNIDVIEEYLLDCLPDFYDNDFIKYVLAFVQSINGVDIVKIISEIYNFINNWYENKPRLISAFSINKLEELLGEIIKVKGRKEQNFLIKYYSNR